MAHLDAARLEEFQNFFKKYYVPNNAVLTIAGDIDVEKTRSLVKNYFSDIPKGAPVVYTKVEDAPLTRAIIDTAYDPNIQLPAIMAGYRVPGMPTKDSKVMGLISSVLSQGASSKLYKKMVDEKKNAVQVGAFNLSLEDYGAYITYALPNNNTPVNTLLKDIDEEVVALQTNLISEADYQKLLNQFENNYVTANSRMLGVAENLATGYTFHNKNTGYINNELNEIKSITREDIRNAARKYLNPDSRVVLYYLPTSK
jgi:predicted Zn-dependent peptidase